MSGNIFQSKALSYRLIETIELLAAQTTQDFVTPLDGSIDKGYMVELLAVNATVGAIDYALRINGATWAANRQTLLASGAVASCARDTTTTIGSAAASSSACIAVALPRATTGYPRQASALAIQDVSTAITRLATVFAITTPANTVNITSLGILASAADGLGIGTIMRLYRLTA